MFRGLRGFLVLAAALVLQGAAVHPDQPPVRPPVVIPAPDDADDVLTIHGARPPPDVAPISYDLTIEPDAQALKTHGEVRIVVDVKSPVHAITLNAYQLALSDAEVDGAPAQSIQTNEPDQTATIGLARTLPPGRHSLSIAFTGRIARTAYGLFAVDYRGQDGAPERLLATQFETTAAHRVLPCWDDPASKAVFTLHVIAPANRMVVSNTPSRQSRNLSGGRRQVDFTATPKMSPYLLFLSIGDYERIHRVVNGTDIGVIMRRGEAEKGRFALDSAAEVLRYYNSYFGLHYPLPKLDMIGAPVSSNSFAAMENWGALFYLERSILLPPVAADEDVRKQYIFNVVAHEMAHQWFGDLVTMRDWNELWLNEGFANWMAAKAADTLHPDWQSQIQELSGRERAMAVDARPGAPPIVVHGVNASTAEIPTAITYGKGEYVVRMVEASLGDDVFRDGIRRYIRQNQFGNTTSDDLWSALKEVSRVDVGSFAHGFTDQPGIPLIRAETTPQGLRLSQARFGINEAVRTATVWQTPVAFAELGGRGMQRRTVSAGAPVGLPVPPGAAVVLNAGQTAYLRVDYDAASFSALRQAFGRLSAIDQMGILNDQWALATAGYRPLGQWLSLLRQLPPDASPVVWSEVIERLATFDNYYVDGPQREAFHRAVETLVARQSARVGPEPRGDDGPNTATLRGQIDLLSDRFGYPKPPTGARPPIRPPYEQLDQVNAWVGTR